MTNVRVGVGCLVTSVDHPNCILLGKRKGSHGAGRLAAPGGHLELGETWTECATREIAEETNLTVDNVKFIHATNDINIDNNPSKHYVTIFVQCEVSSTSKELINMEPHKCEEWLWYPWNEVVAIAHSEPSVLFDPLLHFIQEKDSFLLQ